VKIPVGPTEMEKVEEEKMEKGGWMEEGWKMKSF
jgi:hypothetical protein